MELNKTVGYNYQIGGGDDAAQVVIFDCEPKVRTIDLLSFRKERITFGRADDNDIVIHSPLVSRHSHGHFTLKNGRVLIKDSIESTNGLLYAERPITEKELREGDAIRIDRIVGGSDDASGERQRDQAGVLLLFTRSGADSDWDFFPTEGKKRITIGRDSACDLSLNHPSISKVHAVIEKRDDGWRIIDNHSTNGILINGTLVDGRRRLYEKDVIHLAGARIVFSELGLHYQLSAHGISVLAENVVKRVGKSNLVICNHANLYVKPGELVSIIGGSGSGKSTLMNCLCGYSKPDEGSIKLNGEDLYAGLNVFRNIIGFVPQDDIVFGSLTVQSMLEYTALLRLPQDTAEEERKERIRQVIEMVELKGKEQTYIRQLSGGQRKRVSIAVELISDPSLLFLDEPTSGLDPGTEQSLMRTLKAMTKHGKTIILVTHSTLQLQMCDKIAFMGRGGNLCFCGNYRDAMEFFQTNNIIDVYGLIASEPEVWKNVYDLRYGDTSGTRSAASGETVSQTKDKSAWWQFRVLCRRNLELLKNDRQRLLLLLIQAPLLAVLIYLVSDGNQFEQYEMTKSLLFALACSAFWLGTLNSIQEVCKERSIIKREYMTGVHRAGFVLSKLAVLGLACLVQSLLMVGTFVVLLGSPDQGVMIGPRIELFITSFLTALAATATGLFVSALFKNADRAMTVAPLLLMPQILFSGMVFELKGVTKLLSAIVTCRWAMEGYGTTADLNSLPLRLQQQGIAVEHKIDDFFEFTAAHELGVWIVLIIFVIAFSAAGVFALRNLKDQH